MIKLFAIYQASWKTQ